MPILRLAQIPRSQRPEFVRVRHGWYASADVSSEEIRACEIGGSLTAASALPRYGIWLWPDRDLHVRVGRSANPTRAGGVCLHYRGRTEYGTDGLAVSLIELSRCAGDLQLATALDSVLNLKLLTWNDLLSISQTSSQRFRDAVGAAELGMQSGYETKMRLFLRGHRIGYRSQVSISGVGRVDFLLGSSLVIEMDGYQFHTREQFSVDRRRDLELHRRGYIVVRVSSRMADLEWDDVCQSILHMVRRRVHRSIPRES